MDKDKRFDIDYDNGDMDLLSGGSSSPPRSLPASAAGLNYIQHPVSKFDTLAGVAIKYGVEVADIKRLNGLVTDLQMFALKTLQIPLPGRHPPSPSLSNGHDTPPRPSSSERTPPNPNRRHSDIINSLQSLRLKSSELKVSSAMSSLQSYYGLKQPDQKAGAEGFEMAVYRNGAAHSPEVGPFSTLSLPNPPLSHQRKSKSVSNGLMFANGDLHDPLLAPEAEDSSSDRWIEKLLRRRQKSEADFTSRPTEQLLKEENSNSSAVSAITGKRLALRPKSANRTVSGGVDTDSVGMNPIIPTGLGDSFVTDTIDSGVRKSSSASSLQDSENGALSSIWPTSKWSLKPDFQALSSAAIPMFDGLPKPMNRRNKAALD